MATPQTYTQQQIKTALSGAVTSLETLRAKCKEALAANTEDLTGTSHHAYRSLVAGAVDVLDGVLDGKLITGGMPESTGNAQCSGSSGTLRFTGLSDLVTKLEERTYSVTINLNGCTMDSGYSAPTVDPQVPGTTFVAPSLAHIVCPDVATDPDNGIPYTKYKLVGWSLVKHTPGTVNDINTAELLIPGSSTMNSCFMPAKNITLYAYYDYDRTSVPGYDELLAAQQPKK